IPYLRELGVGAGSCLLPYLKQTAFTGILDAIKLCGIAVACGVVCAALGSGFNRLTEWLSKLFGKIKSNTLRLLPAFLLAAVCGLSLYLLAGSGEATLANVNVDTAAWLLITVLVVRYITTAVASGSGATGGLFLPMIAIGGLIGTLIAKLCVYLGLSEEYSANIVILCICAYFASSVRAPITAIALSVELTFSFVNLLPCVIAVAVSTLITELTGTEPLYERMLDDIRKATPLSTECRIVRGIIKDKTPLCYKRVANVLWPFNCIVTELERNDKTLVPDGDTVLLPGDILTVRAENVEPDVFTHEINEFLIPCTEDKQ
ncbi:MAG: chloride channel protein, partial [Clostridiales bacterium]|nr:chloride channel protein [Clostridiales bacterium]